MLYKKKVIRNSLYSPVNYIATLFYLKRKQKQDFFHTSFDFLKGGQTLNSSGENSYIVKNVKQKNIFVKSPLYFKRKHKLKF